MRPEHICTFSVKESLMQVYKKRGNGNYRMKYRTEYSNKISVCGHPIFSVLWVGKQLIYYINQMMQVITDAPEF